MKAEELIKHLNDRYGMKDDWPPFITVDAETYGYCCQAVFDYYISKMIKDRLPHERMLLSVTVGPKKGLLFKNVELIME